MAKAACVEFIVARNPDPISKLPYLLVLPLAGGTWLKAKETWPRNTRVYCHPADPLRTEDLEIIERVRVVSCVRRGAAIDLILARGINKRSQFITTVFRGRSMILWQTAKVVTSARALRLYVRRTRYRACAPRAARRRLRC